MITLEQSQDIKHYYNDAVLTTTNDLEKYYNRDNKDYTKVSVAFSPDVTARKKAKIGRSYIGLKCENNICNTLIFFVADNKN